MGENSCYLELGKGFWDTPPKARPIKENIDKLGFIKIYSAKDTVKWMKRQDTRLGGNNLQIIYHT